MEVNFYHNSLKKHLVKDMFGNYPFWIRCSAINQYDTVEPTYKPLESVFELVTIKPFTSDIYGLKQGYLLLKHGDSYYEYEFNDKFCDYDIQPYIDRKEVWFKECEIKVDDCLDSSE